RSTPRRAPTSARSCAASATRRPPTPAATPRSSSVGRASWRCCTRPSPGRAPAGPRSSSSTGRRGSGRARSPATSRPRPAGPGAAVLASRHYERESYPYRGADATLEALSRFLVRLPSAEVDELLPPDAPLMAQVFPSLRRLRRWPEPALTAAVEPRELRQR